MDQNKQIQIDSNLFSDMNSHFFSEQGSTERNDDTVAFQRMESEQRRKDTVIRKQPRHEIDYELFDCADEEQNKKLQHMIHENTQIIDAGIRQAKRKALSSQKSCHELVSDAKGLIKTFQTAVNKIKKEAVQQSRTQLSPIDTEYIENKENMSR